MFFGHAIGHCREFSKFVKRISHEKVLTLRLYYQEERDLEYFSALR